MEKETYYKIAVIILIIALASVIIQNQMILSGQDKEAGNSNTTVLSKEEQKTEPVSESEILEKLKQFPEIEPYKDYSAEITILTEENLAELSKSYPAIYKDIEPGAYRVVFESNGEGLLIIYNPDENKILKEFELRNVKL